MNNINVGDKVKIIGSKFYNVDPDIIYEVNYVQGREMNIIDIKVNKDYCRFYPGEYVVVNSTYQNNNDTKLNTRIKVLENVLYKMAKLEQDETKRRVILDGLSKV